MFDKTFESGLPEDAHLCRVAVDAIEAVMAEFPFWATDLGLHQWDDRMPDWSTAGRAHWRSRVEAVRRALAEVSSEALSLEDWADWVTLSGQVELMWDDVDQYHPEQRDPNLVNAIIGESILSVTRRAVGEISERSQNLLSRLERAPELLKQAQRQLHHPPQIFVDMAMAQCEASVPMIEGLAETSDSAHRARIEEASRRLVQAYHEYVAFLKERWSGQTEGGFRLGSDRYRRRLNWLEGVDETLPVLLARGYDELNRLQVALAKLVTQIGPEISVADAVERMHRQHPSPDQLLDRVRDTLDGLRQFTDQHDLVPLPSTQHPLVVETPAFMRMTTVASISPVGPFERLEAESYYQVTLPDPGASHEQIRDQMAPFNPATLKIISAHEVYPGHYAQFLNLPKSRSTVRKVFGSGAFVEGWAHYVEELMIEQGYEDGDPWIRLAQIMEALERVGRYIVGIRLHTGDMTLEQAEQFFVEECSMLAVNAKREALRGTVDPFYLIYTHGKLEILRLREKAKALAADHFNLSEFHSSLLSHGMPTFPVLERLMFP